MGGEGEDKVDRRMGGPGALRTVPLTSIVREMLRSADREMTFGELHDGLLGVGVVLESGELSSVLQKLEHGTREVERMRVPRRARTGPSVVSAWRWR